MALFPVPDLVGDNRGSLVHRETLREGVELAADVIDKGLAKTALAKLVEITA